MTDDQAPHDVVALLEMLMRDGADAPLCGDQSTNVAELVWIGDDASHFLDAEAAALARDAHYGERVLEFRYAAYVQPDATLVLVGQTAKGAFVFRIPPGGWGWRRPVS